MMKALIVLALLSVTGLVHAQIPWSPAFDSDVYMPQLGKPGEWDTLHVDWAKDVDMVYNLGPTAAESYGRIALTGYPTNPPFLTAMHTGPELRLNDLQPIAKTTFKHRGEVCHFRSSSFNDLLDGQTIYWQLADGTYSNDSITNLKFGDTAGMWFQSNFYHAVLVSDSTEDLLATGYNTHKQPDPRLVDYYILLFSSEHLYGQRVAYPDSIYHIEQNPDSKDSGISGAFKSGDWRGTGRNDAISYVYGWLGYYRNDPPFSMQKFRDAMLNDTLFSSEEYYDGGVPLTLHALPHRGDTALDLLFPFRSKTTGVFSMYIFKGGPNFGSKRLHLDSADYEMKDPRFYDHTGTFNGMDQWGTGAADVGDFTGTGRKFITIGGTINGNSTGLNFYYVLGNATDDKADMFEVENYGLSGWDTAYAYKYPMGSLLQVTPINRRLELLHGSNRIPIHINPKFAAVRERPEVQGITIYPNPVQSVIHCTLHVTAPGEAQLTLFNVLGQEVAQWQRQVGYGTQSIELLLPTIPSGEYVLLCRSAHTQLSSKVSIIR